MSMYKIQSIRHHRSRRSTGRDERKIARSQKYVQKDPCGSGQNNKNTSTNNAHAYMYMPACLPACLYHARCDGIKMRSTNISNASPCMSFMYAQVQRCTPTVNQLAGAQRSSTTMKIPDMHDAEDVNPRAGTYTAPRRRRRRRSIDLYQNNATHGVCTTFIRCNVAQRI